MSADQMRQYLDTVGVRPENHGGPLNWFEGTTYPMRGSVKNPLYSHELDNLEPAFDFKCQIFHLNQEDELAEYKLIKERVENGWYQLRYTHRNETDHENISIYLEWVQIYGEVPNAKKPPNPN